MTDSPPLIRRYAVFPQTIPPPWSWLFLSPPGYVGSGQTWLHPGAPLGWGWSVWPFDAPSSWRLNNRESVSHNSVCWTLTCSINAWRKQNITILITKIWEMEYQSMVHVHSVDLFLSFVTICCSFKLFYHKGMRKRLDLIISDHDSSLFS